MFIFLLQAELQSLQVFAFEGQTLKFTVKCCLTCILYCDAGPGCDSNCLQVQWLDPYH